MELQRFVDQIAIPVTVCHFPPGTSKWNKIEHRLFSFITQNWRSKPLVSHEVIINLIAATTTETGWRVHAEIDASECPLGKKVTDAELAEVNIQRHEFHGEWNYTILPSENGTVISCHFLSTIGLIALLTAATSISTDLFLAACLAQASIVGGFGKFGQMQIYSARKVGRTSPFSTDPTALNFDSPSAHRLISWLPIRYDFSRSEILSHPRRGGNTSVPFFANNWMR